MRKIFLLVTVILIMTASLWAEKSIIRCSLDTRANNHLRLFSPSVNKFLLDMENLYFEGHYADDNFIFRAKEGQPYLVLIELLRFQPEKEVKVLLTVKNDKNNTVLLEEIINHQWIQYKSRQPAKKSEEDGVFNQAIEAIGDAMEDLSETEREYRLNARFLANHLYKIFSREIRKAEKKQAD